MINIWISRDGVKVDGHAGYDEPGKDIVCAAMSAFFVFLEDGLELLKKGKADGPNICIDQPDERTDLLILAFQKACEDLEACYPHYVHIKKRASDIKITLR